jgi:hypothetical protein
MIEMSQVKLKKTPKEDRFKPKSSAPAKKYGMVNSFKTNPLKVISEKKQTEQVVQA